MRPQRSNSLGRSESQEIDLEKKEEAFVDNVAVLPDGERQTVPLYTEEEEAFLATFDEKKLAKMYRKIDIRLLPMLGMLYLFACESNNTDRC